MYTLSIETSGHYVIEDLNTRFSDEEKTCIIHTFRLSYYQHTWMTDTTSVVFYLAWKGNDVYNYSLDTKTWYESLDEMVATLRKWTQVGREIIKYPIVLEPLRSVLTLKTLSGNLFTLEIDYANIHQTPYQQLTTFMREQGIIGEYAVFDDEGVVKNFETDIFSSHSVMNIFVN